MRTFVAIDLSEEIRGRIVPLVEALRPLARGARWVDTGAMHLTLKFIGEISEEKCAAVGRALETVRLNNAILLALRDVGFFPNERHPRVFWIGVEAPPALGQLAQMVESALEPLGIAREQRAFSPHLTLARFKSVEGLARMHEALAQLASREFGSLEARSFFLFRSLLSPKGAQYVKLRQFNFADST